MSVFTYNHPFWLYTTGALYLDLHLSIYSCSLLHIL